ncbi:ATP-dependent DNA ligase [Agromyces bauzanensis]|uniref:DUF7882 domain-containing protein n=1 Tax=Agromyces bauzanensis TaxID=1308924 RepID=A0A917UVK3_9MICO|nr:ATP-dependent DNA ligase [Agromyces bauzanensis]GGJ88563.1 hypothetical protein GCM10011372_28950 [Agromyces bauzanensis]
MGVLVYDRDFEVDIEDRTLAHLQVVIIDKLRRQERFPLVLEDGKRERVIWMTPETPLQFVYHGNRHPLLNRDWLEKLAEAAGSTRGLTVLPEPPM